MTWRNKTVEEERLDFILMIANSTLTFEEICNHYQISRKTGYKWLKRYQLHGQEGLKDLSRKRLTQEHKICEEIKESIIAVKKQYPLWGPKKIHAFMKISFSDKSLPSVSSIGNILKDYDLCQSRRYRKHIAKTAPLSHCKKPNDIWMYDFKGPFYTLNGQKCEPLTITDGYSRYLIACEHLTRKTEAEVWMVLEQAFREYGLPNKIRSDNGPPFATISVGRLSRLAVKLIKVGITPEWIEPGCPEQNGRHERFHATLKMETANPSAFNLNMQKEKFKQFKVYYNTIRPHEALDFNVPSQLYTSSFRKWDGKFKSPEYTSDSEIRKVEISGHVNWKGYKFFLSEVLKGEFVAIKEIEYGLMGIYFGPILLANIDLNKGFKKI